LSGCEKALIIDLRDRGLLRRQMEVIFGYNREGFVRHRLARFVEDTIVLDLKAIKNLEDIHLAAARCDLEVAGKLQGLLQNFANTTIATKRAVDS